jgi:hypothetical protein
METTERVAESTARTTFAMAVHPINTIREPVCTAGVHPSHAHNFLKEEGCYKGARKQLRCN